MLEHGDPDKTVDFGWFFFAWRDREGWGLIDTGFEDSDGSERFGLTEHVPPHELLRSLGAGEVRRVVLTHGHFDHAGTAARYPGARFVMARAELDAMRAALREETWHLGYRRRELEALEHLDLELIEDTEVRWGLTLEVVGGHTPGMLAVGWSPELVLAGDNAYLFANIEQSRPIGSLVGPDALAGLLQRGIRLVPGHDLALLERFPRVSERIACLASDRPLAG